MSSSDLWSDDDDDILLANASELESQKTSNHSDEAEELKGSNASESNSLKKCQNRDDKTRASNTEYDSCSSGVTNGQVEYVLETKPRRLKRVHSPTPKGDADKPVNKVSNPWDQKTSANLNIDQKGDSIPVKDSETPGNLAQASASSCCESKDDNKCKLFNESCETFYKNELNESVNISIKQNVSEISDKIKDPILVTSSKDSVSENTTNSEDQNTSAPKLSPLERFRPGYLWVSDLTQQNWCEQQMYYSFTLPGLVEEKPVMTEGTNLHLERELAVHDVVNVNVTSSEDIWAIKVLNMISSIQVFLNNGTLAREVPIFGAPFNEDVFIVGLIDELRFDPNTFLVELWELKTRNRKSLPSKSQKNQHRLQVMLYQKLFDDLVKGSVKKEKVARHLRLDLTREFGNDVRQQITNSYLDCKNLDELMDTLFQRMQCITCIQGLSIEYVHQDSKETIGVETCTYSESELEAMYRDYMAFWRGDRESHGVDIEEAWKCQTCDFADICDWRKQKAEECCNKNRLK